MSQLVDDTIGGFNSFIDEQRNQPDEARITTVLFDDKYEVLHNNVDIRDIKPLTRQDYSARGMTALVDAVGKAINTVGGELSNMNETEKPGKIIFVITTDGQENSSKEFNAAQVKEMIEHQQKRITGHSYSSVPTLIPFLRQVKSVSTQRLLLIIRLLALVLNRCILRFPEP
jgi:uncharacterized protein YegL